MPYFQRPAVAGDSRRTIALDVLGAALAAVEPGEAVRRALQREGDRLIVGGRTVDLARFRRVWVVGAGKASAPMAAAVEEVLGDRVSGGHVTVKYGYTAPTTRVTLHEAGHPVPDEAGLAGSRAIVDLLRDTREDDLVIAVFSGGGSALMTLPVDGIALADMQALTEALLRSGAPIGTLNTVRKHLSQVKGGQLARHASPATLITLIVSVVVGNPLDVIASGPTVPDPTTAADARAALEQFGVWAPAPESIRRHLEAVMAGQGAETPKPGDPIFERVQNVIIADNARAAEAARDRAEALGLHAAIATTFLEGEAREVAVALASIGKEIAAHNRPIVRPACVLFGGETTVTVRGAGKGGRNQELALAAALALAGTRDISLASLATDGTDGPTDAAGGLVDGETVERAAAQGRSARAALDDNDAYPLLAAAGDLLVTGPTNTNVNDLIALFVW